MSLEWSGQFDAPVDTPPPTCKEAVDTVLDQMNDHAISALKFLGYLAARDGDNSLPRNQWQ